MALNSYYRNGKIYFGFNPEHPESWILAKFKIFDTPVLAGEWIPGKPVVLPKSIEDQITLHIKQELLNCICKN